MGSSADEFIQGLRVDKAFIGTNGISLKEGCTTPNLKEANTKKTNDSSGKGSLYCSRSKQIWKNILCTIYEASKN